MCATNTRRNIISEMPELFIQGQYMKNTGIHHQFAMAAIDETGRFLPDPWSPACDIQAFHDYMMMYLNL